MRKLIASKHAIERYQERVADLPAATIRAILTAPSVQVAAMFGAKFVRIASGHRLVLGNDGYGPIVVTILPAEHFRKQVLRQGLGRFGRTSRAHKRGYDNDPA